MLCRTERLWINSTADDESALYLITYDVLSTVSFNGNNSAVVFADGANIELPENIVNALILPCADIDTFMAELSRSYALEKALREEVEKLLDMVSDEADLQNAHG